MTSIIAKINVIENQIIHKHMMLSGNTELHTYRSTIVLINSYLDPIQGCRSSKLLKTSKTQNTTFVMPYPSGIETKTYMNHLILNQSIITE